MDQVQLSCLTHLRYNLHRRFLSHHQHATIGTDQIGIAFVEGVLGSLVSPLLHIGEGILDSTLLLGTGPGHSLEHPGREPISLLELTINRCHHRVALQHLLHRDA